MSVRLLAIFKTGFLGLIELFQVERQDISLLKQHMQNAMHTFFSSYLLVCTQTFSNMCCVLTAPGPAVLWFV